jgi:hypothetical protein
MATSIEQSVMLAHRLIKLIRMAFDMPWARSVSRGFIFDRVQHILHQHILHQHILVQLGLAQRLDAGNGVLLCGLPPKSSHSFGSGFWFWPPVAGKEPAVAKLRTCASASIRGACSKIRTVHK